MNSSIGFDNPLWYVGIVQNNDDSIKQGRVQIRAFGIHPPITSNTVDRDDLPWAPVLNAGSGGAVLPAIGDWVFGCFIDGRDAQHPIVFGIIPGQNLELPAGTGSSDIYSAIESIKQYGIPPLGKIMSGEDLETTQLVLQNAFRKLQGPAKTAKQIAEKLEEIDPKTLAPSIQEPGVPVSNQPHKNMVWKSRNSNSYIQIAENEEFIVISHEKGSHVQIDSGGNIKIKSFGDAHYYSEGHMFEAASGSKTIHIEGNYALECKSVTLQVNGDMNHVVKGDYNLNVGGKIGITAGESFEVGSQRMSLASTSEHFNLKSAQKIKLDADGNLSLKSGSDMYITSGSTLHSVAASDTYNSAGGSYNISAAGMYATADPIHLNSAGNAAVAATATPETTKAPELDLPVEREVTNVGTEVQSTPGQSGAFDSDESVEV